MLWHFTWHSADIFPYYTKCNYASLRALTYKVITFVHKETYLSSCMCYLKLFNTERIICRPPATPTWARSSRFCTGTDLWESRMYRSAKYSAQKSVYIYIKICTLVSSSVSYVTGLSILVLNSASNCWLLFLIRITKPKCFWCCVGRARKTINFHLSMRPSFHPSSLP